jgi:hypothetical protein
MRRLTRVFIGMSLVLVACYALHAQEIEEPTDDPRMNTNLGANVAVPVHQTSQYNGVGGGVTVGAGYNFTRSHALVGEFMWNRLFGSDNGYIKGNNDLFSLTANYRYESRGDKFGWYLIGGGGWYYRSSIPNTSSSTFGGNGGIGFTIRTGAEPYRGYFEARYHYAPTKYVSTQLFEFTIGIRR